MVWSRLELNTGSGSLLVSGGNGSWNPMGFKPYSGCSERRLAKSEPMSAAPTIKVQWLTHPRRRAGRTTSLAPVRKARTATIDPTTDHHQMRPRSSPRAAGIVPVPLSLKAYTMVPEISRRPDNPERSFRTDGWRRQRYSPADSVSATKASAVRRRRPPTSPRTYRWGSDQEEDIAGHDPRTVPRRAETRTTRCQAVGGGFTKVD